MWADTTPLFPGHIIHVISTRQHACRLHDDLHIQTLAVEYLEEFVTALTGIPLTGSRMECNRGYG